jgi:hypothetical protein
MIKTRKPLDQLDKTINPGQVGMAENAALRVPTQWDETRAGRMMGRRFPPKAGNRVRFPEQQVQGFLHSDIES